MRRAARAVPLLAGLALAVGSAPALALNVVSDSQAVVGNQCVGVACSTTDTPPLSFVVRNNDTPVMRLDQSNLVFDAYTWDVAGNDANFFIRDVTGGNALPFRLFPGAATDTLTLTAAGVGIGTRAPDSLLDLRRSGARLSVTDADTTAGSRVLARLVNRGAPLLRMDDTSPNGQDWLVGAADDGAFAVRAAADGSPAALLVTPAGTATARGVLQQSADEALRTDVQPVDSAALLRALRGLKITSATSAADVSGTRHLAPSGTAFRDAFALGGDGAALAPADLATVALVAAQQLADRDDALGGRVDALQAAAAGLGTRTDALASTVDSATASLGALATRVERVEAGGAGGTNGTNGAGGAGGADRQTVARLRTDNAALARRVATLERRRGAQQRRVDTLAGRQRTTTRRLGRLQRQLDALSRGR